MMLANTAIVITTIQRSTSCLRVIGERAEQHGVRWIVIGDRKGPDRFAFDSAEFVGIERQKELPFRLAKLLPENHYARKNLGYLLAMSYDCQCIYETDDDNAPTDAWQARSLQLEVCRLEHRSAAHWVNAYQVFSSELIWPRGLPLTQVQRRLTDDFLLQPHPTLVVAPVQQGLANGSPDVDAIWRLLLDNEITFSDGPNILLPRGAWCPFNSQNTWWWRVAFPLLYLPSYCSFRMTDIWRSFVAQRCLWELNYELEFHHADVMQLRNEHDYMRDFEQECIGYLRNENIRQVLEACQLRVGLDALADNILRCYEALVSKSILGPEELELVTAWLEDVAACNPPAALRSERWLL